MLKYDNGKYLEMTQEEIEELKAQEKETEGLTTLTLTQEQIELLQKILGG